MPPSALIRSWPSAACPFVFSKRTRPCGSLPRSKRAFGRRLACVRWRLARRVMRHATKAAYPNGMVHTIKAQSGLGCSVHLLKRGCGCGAAATTQSARRAASSWLLSLLTLRRPDLATSQRLRTRSRRILLAAAPSKLGRLAKRSDWIELS